MTRFHVMTWNLENLKRPLPGDDEDVTDRPSSAEIYQRKLQNLRSIIFSVLDTEMPHVIAAQEVGEEVALADLQAVLDGEYPHMALGDPDGRGIRVAFLSRLPLRRITRRRTFPRGAFSYRASDGTSKRDFGRGLLQVTVAPTESMDVTLINLHLKSKLITYPSLPNSDEPRFFPFDENERAVMTGYANMRRTAEAVALRFHINNLIVDTDQAVIALGDFNDTPDAVTNQIITGPTDRNLRFPDQLDDIRLYNLADQIPELHRYSRIFQKSPELIDHIMVSYELIKTVIRADSFVERTISIDADASLRRDEPFPDHAPVFASFELG